MSISPSEIELNLDVLAKKPFDPGSFFFDFIEAHDAPKAAVTRIRNSVDLVPEEYVWPRKVAFRVALPGQLAPVLAAMKEKTSKVKSAPRFLIVSDGIDISGYDREADESWHDQFVKLNSHFNMTLPLAGLERYKSVDENPADIKAAGRLAKFYDAILDANPSWSGESHRHELNLFMTRVLFCMFAEDTGIFPEEIFTETIDQNTKVDGSDVAELLARVFQALDLRKEDRNDFPSYVDDYPYVNGGLFRDKTLVPLFSKRARAMLIDACQLRWSEINPDIFGSMIQGVVDPKKRGELGMHYTSVPNIMKLIGPLFLNRLHTEFEQAGSNVRRLERLLARLHRIRIFDPACGSGNFLIISYRELRRLETAIFKKIQALSPQSMLPMSQIRLSQFFGVEYADFAAETAKLALWIAEYQANREFEDAFGVSPPALPLRDSGRIVHGNATRVDWLTVCPIDEGAETYVVGNPPYLGRTQQNAEQKADMVCVFEGISKKFRKLDYITCWFIKAGLFAQATGASFAFVTTNSICQGEQVGLLWPHLFKMGVEIEFGHQSFKWRNNASKNAGVTCVIVGMRLRSDGPKQLFNDDVSRTVKHIRPYLFEGDDTIVYPVSNAATKSDNLLRFGNMPADGGNLILSPDQKNALVHAYPEAKALLRRLYGSNEFIKGLERWCLWIEDSNLELANSIPPVKARIEGSRAMREASDDDGTRSLAETPHQFREMYQARDHLLIIPSVSSEERRYFPCGILPASSAVTNLAFAMYDAPMWVMGVTSSRLHALWIKTVCGQLETRDRYSNTLGFNTFPLPDLSEKQKQALEDCAWQIIEARENASGKTIAYLYSPKTMPAALKAAHDNLDATIEKIYKGKSFQNDTDRIEHLFRLYTAQVANRVNN